jgi:uncharacterized protein (TIGR00730 family)
MTIKSIGVFCSSVDIGECSIDMANELASAFLENGLHFVFGGGDRGLMGQLARTMHSKGVPVTGFLPSYFKNMDSQPYGSLVYTSDFHVQLALFDENCDAFIAFPGGIGTMSEIMHVLKTKMSSLHHKPIAILNHDHVYDPFIDWLRNTASRGWLPPHILDNLIIEDSISRLVTRLVARS